MNNQADKDEQTNMCSSPQRSIIISLEGSSSEGKIDTTSAHIALITCFLVSLLTPRDPGNNGVPVLLSSIFRGRIFAFQAFVISVMFSFSTSFSALYLFYKSQPKIARFFRSSSIYCLTFSLTLLFYGVRCYPHKIDPAG